MHKLFRFNFIQTIVNGKIDLNDENTQITYKINIKQE